jgi:hypothetical protein
MWLNYTRKCNRLSAPLNLHFRLMSNVRLVHRLNRGVGENNVRRVIVTCTHWIRVQRWTLILRITRLGASSSNYGACHKEINTNPHKGIWDRYITDWRSAAQDMAASPQEFFFLISVCLLSKLHRGSFLLTCSRTLRCAVVHEPCPLYDICWLLSVIRLLALSLQSAVKFRNLRCFPMWGCLPHAQPPAPEPGGSGLLSFDFSRLGGSSKSLRPR